VRPRVDCLKMGEAFLEAVHRLTDFLFGRPAIGSAGAGLRGADQRFVRLATFSNDLACRILSRINVGPQIVAGDARGFFYRQHMLSPKWLTAAQALGDCALRKANEISQGDLASDCINRRRQGRIWCW